MKKLLYENYEPYPLKRALDAYGNYRIEMRKLEVQEANKEMAELLVIPLGSSFTYLERVVSIDDRREIIIRNYFNHPQMAEIIKQSAADSYYYREIYAAFLLRISRTAEDVSIHRVSKEDAVVLGEDVHDVLYIRGKAFDQMNNLVEYYEYLIDPEVISVRMRFD